MVDVTRLSNTFNIEKYKRVCIDCDHFFSTGWGILKHIKTFVKPLQTYLL